MGGIREEALEGVARGPVPVLGRLGPELHSEVVPWHVDHAGVEGVVVGELQSSSIEARAALQIMQAHIKDPVLGHNIAGKAIQGNDRHDSLSSSLRQR